MNIILGKENAAVVWQKYTVLELDTLQIEDQQEPITAYCLIEETDINNIVLLDTLKEQHNRMMDHYKTRQWHQCLADIESLRGCWSGQMDTFYDEMQSRVTGFLQQDPGQDWQPVLNKTQ